MKVKDIFNKKSAKKIAVGATVGVALPLAAVFFIPGAGLLIGAKLVAASGITGAAIGGAKAVKQAKRGY